MLVKFPKIMGILNATPDSFSDGEGKINYERLFSMAEQMIAHGVDILDIGGESTRPSESVEISADIELSRIMPVIDYLLKNFPNNTISVDTRKSEVADAVLKLGVSIINDISGLQYSKDMVDVVAKHKCGLVIMHSKGITQNMATTPYYDDVTNEVFDFLRAKIDYAKSKGVENIWADVGIGFDKNYSHNLQLLRDHKRFEALGIPLLLGISRKRFIGELLNIATPKDRDCATMLIHSAMYHERYKIDIIRVHNVVLANQMRIINSEILN